MADIEIGRFRKDDIPFGKALTDAEGWCRTVADWYRLLTLEPSGMFVARMSGSRVGIAGILAYDRLAWIHSVIVVPEHRGRGIGKALVAACIDWSEEHGVDCIKLDSVGGVEGFYRGLGFAEEFGSLRFLGHGRACPVTAVRAGPSDLAEISAFDQLMTGLDRTRVLSAILRDSPDGAFCVRRGNELVGYLLARQGQGLVQVGPCVVRDGDRSIAHELMSSLLGSEPSARYRMCVPGKNAAAADLARRLGFESTTPSTRMFLGSKFEESNAAFAMISAEKG